MDIQYAKELLMDPLRWRESRYRRNFAGGG